MDSKPAQSTRPRRTRAIDVARRRKTSRSMLLPYSTVSFLRQLRARLEIARAIVHVSSATLRAQRTDADTDVALILQRSVGDVLGEEMEALDVVLAGGTAPEGTPGESSNVG